MAPYTEIIKRHHTVALKTSNGLHGNLHYNAACSSFFGTREQLPVSSESALPVTKKEGKGEGKRRNDSSCETDGEIQIGMTDRYRGTKVEG